MDFSKFDIDAKKLKEQVKQAEENGVGNDTPKGYYCGEFEKIEIKETRDKRPMLSVMFRIKGQYSDGEDCENLTKKYAKKCVFMNRVIYGTKNDANMISSCVGWLKKLGCEFAVEFESYEKFNDLVLDIAEDVQNVLFDIEYDDSKFNSITILGETGDNVPF